MYVYVYDFFMCMCTYRLSAATPANTIIQKTFAIHFFIFKEKGSTIDQLKVLHQTCEGSIERHNIKNEVDGLENKLQRHRTNRAMKSPASYLI